MKRAPVTRPSGTPHTVAALTADPANRRAHNERNLALIGEALKEVGAARSIVIDEDNLILAGNGVTQAAQAVGLTKLRVVEAAGDEIIAVRRRGLTDAQKRALALFDNRTAELATWNVEQLLADQAAGLDLASYWDAAELAALLNTNGAPKAGLTDPDAVPEVRATEIQRGDLFELGAHRLLCGDATVAADVARVMGSGRIDTVVTDPPYNVGKNFSNDRLSTPAATEFIQRWTEQIPGTAHTLISFFSPQTMPLLIDAARAAQWRFGRALWLWKPGTAFGVVPWHGWARRSEIILVFERAAKWPPFVQYHADMYEWVKHDGTAVEDTTSDATVLHPTLKPVAIVEDLIKHTVGAIYEPFAGSGTTLMAGERLTRQVLALEIEPQYCQVALDRWAAFTGQTPKKVGEAVRPPVTHHKVTGGRTVKAPAQAAQPPARRRRRQA